MIMAIGVSPLSSSLSGLATGRNGANGSLADVPLGLRGSVSVGSGLRTGVTVVNHALRVQDRLSEEREQAREAAEEQARQDAADAQRSEIAGNAATANATTAFASTQTANGPNDSGSTGPVAAGSASSVSGAIGQDNQGTSRAINAAVAAGQAGDTTPRGAFLDVSI